MLKLSLHNTRLWNPTHNSEELCYFECFPVNFEYFLYLPRKKMRRDHPFIMCPNFLKNYYFLPSDTYHGEEMLVFQKKEQWIGLDYMCWIKIKLGSLKTTLIFI